MIPILYSDNRVLVCLKPYGVVSVDEPGGLPQLLRQQLNDPNNQCVRTVHRLDQVVGGVMVLARSKEAARRLSGQLADRSFHKVYLAVVSGITPPSGTFRDLLIRDKAQRKTLVTETPGKDAQEAVLHFETLGQTDALSLVRIHLQTGRTHQIRCQFSHHGYPLIGDKKYGGIPSDEEGIALWSCQVTFRHPQSGKEIYFTHIPPDRYPWNLFSISLDSN